MLEKIKLHQGPIFFTLTVVLTGTLGFGLGRLSKLEEAREPVRISQPASVSESLVEAKTAPTSSGSYVASKNGTKYYLLGCAGVARIKEDNKVYFATKAEAERAGLEPAANCPGL